MRKLWKLECDTNYAFVGDLIVATDEQVRDLIEENKVTLVSDDPVVVNSVVYI